MNEELLLALAVGEFTTHTIERNEDEVEYLDHVQQMVNQAKLVSAVNESVQRTARSIRWIRDNHNGDEASARPAFDIRVDIEQLITNGVQIFGVARVKVMRTA